MSGWMYLIAVGFAVAGVVVLDRQSAGRGHIDLVEPAAPAETVGAGKD